MEFGVFAAKAAEIEAEEGDHATIEVVTELFLDAGQDLAIVARFVQGRVFPAWSEQTLDIGPKTCYAALARAAGPEISVSTVEADLAEYGDIGTVAASYELGQQTGLSTFTGDADTSVSVQEVATELQAIAAASGDGSESEKESRLFGLLTQCSSSEARYLARLVLGEMRIGVGEGTVRDAIAAAFDIPVEEVQRAIQVTNDVGHVAELARDAGVAGVAAVQLDVGRPVKAMLAQAGSIADALDAWGEAAVETKFDGARVQLHYDGSAISIFSRNMQDVTASLPEIVEHAESRLDVPAIIDGEVVAIDDHGEPLPFQEVLRRFRRKHDVAAAQEDVELEVHAFDCLHTDGDDLLDDPLTTRHAALTKLLPDAATTLVVTDDPDEIADHAANAVAAGHEGVLMKNPASTYTPGRRGRNWLKRKPDVDTLDLVVTGAEWGEGRRANLLGTFILGARTEDGFATVGKVATGITDDQLETLTDRLTPLITTETGQTVDLAPETVFEVGYEEIQTSPTYESGYALRFPRFIAVREDKPPTEADTVDRIANLVE